MSKLTLLISLLVSSLFITNHVQARSSFGKPIQAAAVITKPDVTANAAGLSMQAKPRTSPVFLMNVPLTGEQKKQLQTFKLQPATMMSSSTELGSLPSRVSLGMGNVPVLDQGQHGACVVFATTAALDAILNQGDYISQLCLLELGNYLENRSYYPTGWEGSFGPLIHQRLSEFGIITKADQIAKSCAGLTQYPASDMNNSGNPMSIDDYAQSSENISLESDWYSLLTTSERFSPEAPRDLIEVSLNKVKRVLALAARDAAQDARLTFGVILPVNHCSVGACAKFNQNNDTWAITNDIRKDQHPEYGGHEMVITGYDDNAIATDNEGNKHKGLLILRNSWSDRHGDNGNYYMTYDFFKQFVMEVQVVTKAM